MPATLRRRGERASVAAEGTPEVEEDFGRAEKGFGADIPEEKGVLDPNVFEIVDGEEEVVVGIFKWLIWILLIGVFDGAEDVWGGFTTSASRNDEQLVTLSSVIY